MLETLIAKLTSPKAINWFYTVACAVLAFAVGYDWIAADKLPLWLGLTSAVLGIGATGTASLRLAKQRRDGTL